MNDIFKMFQSAPKAGRNLRWFLDNYHSLADKYPDKHLAIDNCMVLDNDSNLNKLLERLGENYTSSMMIENPSHWIKRDELMKDGKLQLFFS